jgi:hypothetical protein
VEASLGPHAAAHLSFAKGKSQLLREGGRDGVHHLAEILVIQLPTRSPDPNPR